MLATTSSSSRCRAFQSRSFSQTHIVTSRTVLHTRRTVPPRRIPEAELGLPRDQTAVPQSYTKMTNQGDWTEMQRVRMDRKRLVQYMSDYGSTMTKQNVFHHADPLHRPSDAALSSLMAAGAHMGHSRSLMNPNFMPYAYGVRGNITIIDLDHTLPLLRRAANLVRSIAHANGSIVFIGTRPDLRPVVIKAAERLGKKNGYYVAERWLPGTLTNKLQMFGPEIVLAQQVVPDLVVLLNPIANMNAIRECAIHHVPTIALIDSNVDPRIVMYPIPANDESTRTAELIAGVLSVAGREGAAMRKADQEAAAAAKIARETTPQDATWQQTESEEPEDTAQPE